MLLSLGTRRRHAELSLAFPAAGRPLARRRGGPPQRLQLAASAIEPRVHRAVSKSAVLLAANTTCRQDIGRSLKRTPVLLVETGVSQVAAAPQGHAEQRRVLRILWSGQSVPRKALHLLIEALARLPAEVRYEGCASGPGAAGGALAAAGPPPGRRSPHDLARLAADQESPATVRLGRPVRLHQPPRHLGQRVSGGCPRGFPSSAWTTRGRARDHRRCGVKIAVTRPEQVIDDLAEAILRLARARTRPRRLRPGALQRARQYLWSRQGQRMTALYRQAMTAAGGNGAAVERAAARRFPFRGVRDWLPLRTG